MMPFTSERERTKRGEEGERGRRREGEKGGAGVIYKETW
jgi:hypothetical protein